MATEPREDTVEKVLPCPFCGDEEELRTEPDNACECHCYWWVICGACGGRMIAEREGGAIAAWNTRAAINAMSDVREVLKDLADAARNACDARRHPELTEALFNADAALESLSADQTCQTCKGKGVYYSVPVPPDRGPSMEFECNYCNGTGGGGE